MRTKCVAAVVLLSGVSSVFAQVKLGGSAFMYDRNQSPAAYAAELDQMHAVGMNIVMPVSLGHLNGAPGVDGGPCTALSADGLMYPSALVANPPTDDRLGTLLTLADERGMQVLPGSLQTFGDWTTGAEFNSLNSCNDAVVREVHQMYGSHPSLLGFYSTQEVWLNWVKLYGPSYYAINLLQHLVNSVKAADQRLIVVAAPVFKEYGVGAMPGLTASEAQAALGLLLAGSGLQVVAPQDGQGALAGAPSLAELPAYYSAMLSAARANGAQLWSVLETFVNNGGNQNQYPPAPIARITQQIAAEQPYVANMVTWIFGHDMSYQATYYPVAASQLYMDYQSYCCGVARLQKLPFVYHYGSGNFPLSLPSSAYPDAQLTKLVDGQGGGFGSNGSDWVGFLDSQDANVGAVSIDLGQLRNVQKVRVLYRSELDSFIEAPQLTIVGGTAQNWDASSQTVGVGLAPLPDTQAFSVAWVDVPSTAAGVRYLIVQMVHVGWLFVGEIEVYGN